MWYCSVLPRILNMSLTASISIVFVMLARLALKRAPKLFSYALWAIVLFRLLCPVSFSSGLSLLGALNAPVSENGSVEYLSLSISETENAMTNNIAAGDIQAESGSFRSDMERDWTGKPGIETLAALVWLGGAALMLIYGAVSYVRLRAKLKYAVPLKDDIYISERIESPFVMGLLRPAIYLPLSLEEREREYIILHERYHIRRFDHITKLLAFAALALHWFNPLVYLAFLFSERDMEMSCDEAVMRNMDGDIRADYSQSLLRLATGRSVIAGTTLAFGEGDTKGRIKNVLAYKRPAFWVVAAALALCAVLAACLLANPAKPDSPSAGEDNPYPYVAREWLDFYRDVDMPWDGKMETELSEFPGVKFRWTPAGVEAEADGNISSLYTGMPVWSVFFADLGGDGLPELCSTISIGSGIVDERVIAYDYANKISYELSERMEYDYSLYLRDGRLMAEKRVYNGGRTAETGYLALVNGKLLIRGGAAARAEEGVYVSSECLYMNPLSSFAAVNGDSGCRYRISGDSFEIENKSSGETIAAAAPVEWAWQKFPYTDEEWAGLYFAGGGVENIGELYGEMLYQPLSERYSLFRMDGSLWLAEINENPNMGRNLWSLYILSPEKAAAEDAPERQFGAEADKTIAELFEKIMSSPMAASAPGDYLAAHPDEERELISYGDDTLNYIFSEFIEGGQTGLKGQIMRLVMDELTGFDTEQSETGQEAFDAWLAKARDTRAERGSDYMRENAPKAWMALCMSEEKAKPLS